MPPQILVVNNDPFMRNTLQKCLEQIGGEVFFCTSAEEALEHVKHEIPQLVILDVALSGMNGVDLCKTLRRDPATHSIPIFMLSMKGDVADKIAGFEAGVDDYMVKPFENLELVYRVKNLLARSTPVPAKPEMKQTRRGKVITVFAPKGGVGKTTIATNLAVALHKLSGKHVVILDADFTFGLVGVNLNISSPHNILNLVDNFAAMDKELVQQVLIEHESGIHVLLCPLLPENAEKITAEHISAIVDILSELYSYVVIDCHASYDERTMVMLDKSDIILLVVTPEIGPLMSTSRFLDLVKRLEMHSERIQLVLNRSDSKVGYERTGIERALKMKVKYLLVSGGREVSISGNKGVPLVVQLPKHAFSQGIIEMAKHILSDKIVKPDEANKK